MADSTKGDTVVGCLGLLTSSLIALVAGLVIHSFIITANLNAWSKERYLSPVDQVITTLGISRMCSQCSLSLFVFVSRCFLKNPDSRVIKLFISRVYVFFAYANGWLTALLAIVFCLKISNLQSRLFSSLRGVILHRTVYFILTSVVLSAFSCVTTLILAFTRINKERTYNSTRDNLLPNCIYINSIYSDSIGAIIPQLFFYISSILLFASLYHHTTRMKKSGNLTINLKIYYSAITFVSFTFIYSTVYFIVHCFSVFYYYFYCEYLVQLQIFLGFAPVVHSSYLIYRTAKLKNQMSKVLQSLIVFVLRREGTKTSENIEVVAQ